jgi:uncharacterized membrane protein YecN with MAPEG domain
MSYLLCRYTVLCNLSARGVAKIYGPKVEVVLVALEYRGNVQWALWVWPIIWICGQLIIDIVGVANCESRSQYAHA